MAIDVACAACGWSGRAKDSLAGKRVKCPKCAASIAVGTQVDSPGPATPAPPPGLPPAPASPSFAPGPAPAMPPRPFTAEEAAALVAGRIEPVRTTFAYRFALAAVALAMILLPLAYVAMIGGVACGVWWHLRHHTGLLGDHGLRGKAAMFPILAYATPAVVGAVIVLFMLKPILARRPPQDEPKSLRPEEEPALFALVGSICRAVGAPLPRRIDIDMRVNASASHRRGLSSLFGNDLVLTVGLPLVAGTTVEQFAGILAHEFGHFTQGAGMGFGAIVHRINDWFARVVWQRDAWDVKLREWSNDSGLWIGFVLVLARCAVWLTRRILFGLMWVAHALSCHLSRQMEYDADLHQVRLVGGATVAATFRRLPPLSIGESAAWRTLGDAWVEGVTVDSIPDLVVLGADGLSAEELAALDKQTAEEKSGRFDTHPTTHDRIGRASADRSTPRLECAAPATRLFADFPRLARELTLAILEQVHPGKISAEQLRPASEILSRSGTEREAGQAAARWMGEETSPFLPFPGKGGALQAPAGECAETHRAAKAALLSLTPTTPAEREAMFAPFARHQQTFLIASYVATDRAYRDAEEGLTLRTAEDVESVRRRAWEEFRTRSAPLVERRRQIDRRLRAALGWLASPEALQAIADAPRRRDEVAALTRALGSLEARRVEWTRIMAEFDALAFWIQKAADEDLRDSASKAIPATFERTAAAIRTLREPLLAEPYPLDHADPTMTIGRYLVPEEVVATAPETVWEAAERLGGLFPWLSWQIVGRLALHAEAAEAALERTTAPSA